MRNSKFFTTFVPENRIYTILLSINPLNLTHMTLSTDLIFITDEKEGFRECREKRTTSTKTMTTLLCTAGHIDVYYHGEMIRIGENDLFVRIPDFTQPLGPYEMSPDFEFKQVTIDASVYEQIMYDHMRVEPNWWAKQEFVKRNPIFHINAISMEFFDTYFHLLTLQLQDRLSDYRRQILRLIANGAMMELLNYMDKLAVASTFSKTHHATNQGDYIFHEFLHLLQVNPHEREVQWYAKKLEISPKYLSEVCKAKSDKTASEWITDITVSELKHYLQKTTIPIREVARIMVFPNASFFSQYVRKHLKMTPNRYRKLARV